ncbi:hypothetical protein IGB42_03558 [Andreprevotia sp. IGB-42]|uniref:SPOR domain-containing protein n=1 Tax=Andreprevotia sp. IGB-42 TaxID=2497473 RepID=UPI00135C0903|nr:SPOR domain-containing protein [Andreprevotia sp. IGB-42]KAF0812016.1 hypothetical protein IGB42_03558 [Andreprevotia sp. IGB-42]
MKWLFCILVIANLLFFGYTRLVPQTPPPRVAPKEINASQVNVVNGANTSEASAAMPEHAASPAPTVPPTSTEAAPEATPQPTTPARPTAAPKPSPAPSPSPAPVTQAQAAGNLCLRWTGITGDQASLARDKLRQLGLTGQENTAAQNAKFWVYVPPLADIETAKKKAQQFSELGVDDYFVVNNGSKWQNAISLGIFSTQEAGERRLEELRNKGVKSAIVRERDDGVRHTSFLIRKASEEQQAKLIKVGELLRGSQVEKVACN